MSQDRLKALGMSVRPEGEADLSLTAGALVNPLTKKALTSAQFMLVGERLIAIAPPELVGLPPLTLSAVSDRAHLEAEIAASFDVHVRHLEGRSAELQALGIAAQVDPETLELTAHLEEGTHTFVLVSDKQGQFRVGRILEKGFEVQTAVGQPFELSEFRERSALAGYLRELLVPGAAAAGPADRKTSEPAVLFSEIARRFGTSARLPPRSALEIVVELRCQGAPYRFAAARLTGRSFRGLLAGPSGKVWAGRFELDDFAGPAALLAQHLGTSVDAVELLSPVATPL